MKCVKCGTSNAKTNDVCKKCGANLKQEETVEEVKIEEIKVDENKKKKTKKNKVKGLAKVLLILKWVAITLIGLIIIGLIYFGCLFNYEKHYEKNLNRYYETENTKYADHITYIFNIINYNDSKVSDVQSKGYEIIEGWIEDLKLLEKYDDKFYSDVERLDDLLDTLYNYVDANGTTVISKKAYNSLKYDVEALYDLYMNDTPVQISALTENFNVLNINGILSLFDKEEKSIVLIGSNDVSTYADFYSLLENAQDKYNFVTNYMNYDSVDKTQESYNELLDKMTIEYTVGTDTKTLADFFGYTPMMFIIEDGEITDARIGEYTEGQLSAFFVGHNVK